MDSRRRNAALFSAAAALATGGAHAAQRDEPAPIPYASVAAAREALRTDPKATMRNQQGWTVVASRENGAAVEWFFTPEAHPVYPAVIKRTVVEHDGVGMIDMAALCETPQDACDQLLEDFRQTHKPVIEAPRVERVALDVGITQNDHARVRVNRLVAEAGKAAEIRMDGLLKAVIVPTLDENGGVTLWTAMYEFDGREFALVAEPQLVTPGAGTAEVELAAASGNRFAFSITPLPLPRQE
ncbi:MAG TPA: hypothetical protein VHH11_07070 [Gammaproteobacteria bacterium]|nr:hypothetical protein [Gammaproteobacteria bacterium]